VIIVAEGYSRITLRATNYEPRVYLSLTDKDIYPTVIIVNTLDKEHLQMISSTFSEATTRRAALGAIIAAGAIGVAPIAAGAAIAAEPVNGVAGLDAGLLALIDEARAAGARVEAAIAALEEAQERTEEVPWPQTLIVTEDDTRLWKLKAGDRFDLAHLSLMKERQANGQKLKDSIARLSPAALDALAPCVANMDDKDRAAIEKLRAAEARADQLIAARDRWREALRVAEERSGETAADGRVEQRMNEKYDTYTCVLILARGRGREFWPNSPSSRQTSTSRLRSFRQKRERPSQYCSASRWTSRR
jgi:hypothetical protein